MRRGVALCTGWAMLLGGIAVANARGAHDLSDNELHSEMTRNRALAAYVARRGEPGRGGGRRRRACSRSGRGPCVEVRERVPQVAPEVSEVRARAPLGRNPARARA